MPFPIGSLINRFPVASPWDSTREALLYEILQALGGNPDQIMMRDWTEGNEGNQRPPYTSLTDALLYEIWMVIGNQGGGGTGDTAIIYYGIVKDGTTPNPAAGIGSKIIKASASYYVVPPAINNLAGNEAENVRFWIAEPVTETAKTATLWIRNQVTTFINHEVGTGSLMATSEINSYRVYLSEPLPAGLFDGQKIGPVFMSRVAKSNVDFGTVNPGPTAYQHEVRIQSMVKDGICSVPTQLVYSDSQTLTTGSLLYNDIALTQPLNVSGFIVRSDGAVFVLDINEVAIQTNDFC